VVVVVVGVAVVVAGMDAHPWTCQGQMLGTLARRRLGWLCSWPVGFWPGGSCTVV
jgi:hypothetical protein